VCLSIKQKKKNKTEHQKTASQVKAKSCDEHFSRCGSRDFLSYSFVEEESKQLHVFQVEPRSMNAFLREKSIVCFRHTLYVKQKQKRKEVKSGFPIAIPRY